jgi:oligopeptide/dipeptide ABC transporter ATP-binding protein
MNAGADLSNEEVLSVTDLHVEVFDKANVSTVVDGVSFSLKANETLGIVGESGSGKSVTARALLGLLPWPLRVVSGSAIFEERDLLQLSTRELAPLRGRRISMVFQDPLASLNPLQSCGRQIDEALQTHKFGPRAERWARVVDLLHSVGIPDPERRARQYPHEFSGGMRQRVMIAIALANDPSIIIADEPTTALDVTIQAQVMDVFRTIRERSDLSVILISHDLGLIAENSNRIIVLYAGRVMESGQTREVLDAPRHPYTRALLNALPALDGKRHKLAHLEGRPPSPSQRPGGCPFHPRCPMSQGREVCVSEVPALRSLPQTQRMTACHFAEELEPEGPPR